MGQKFGLDLPWQFQLELGLLMTAASATELAGSDWSRLASAMKLTVCSTCLSSLADNCGLVNLVVVTGIIRTRP